MKEPEILSNLCHYDPRNPNGTKDEEEIEDHKNRAEECYCDNCFYGRTILAQEILNLQFQLDSATGN